MINGGTVQRNSAKTGLVVVVVEDLVLSTLN